MPKGEVIWSFQQIFGKEYVHENIFKSKYRGPRSGGRVENVRKFSMEWELVKKRKYSWKSPRKVNTEDEGVGGGQLAELRVFGAKSLIYWQSPLTCSLHSHAIISFLIILDNATVAKMSLMPFLKIILSIAKITESPIYWKFFSTFFTIRNILM